MAENFIEITILKPSPENKNALKAVRVLCRGDVQAKVVKSGETVEVEKVEAETLIGMGRAALASKKAKEK